MQIYNFDKITQEKVYGLQQGFFISFDVNRKIVITIKSDAALLTSLIKGCPLYLVLNKKNSSTKIIIEDNVQSPFFIIGKDFSEKSKEHTNFENIIIEFLKATSFQLIYLNDANYQIFCNNITKSIHFESFKKWILSDTEEFIIKIENRDFSNEIDMKIIDILQNQKWNGNLINGKSYYNFKEYLLDGKHGYNQEFSIRNSLSNYFIPNEELFYSVNKMNNEELTDFLIIYKKAIVIIESKYTISKKQSKFNDSLVKAITQLNCAEDIIYDDLDQIKNADLKNQISDFQIVIKICLFNDDGRDLKTAFKNVIEKYDKNILPIFISVVVLNQFLASLKIQNPEHYKLNLIGNLLRLKSQFEEKKIIILDGFDIETGAVTLLY